MIVDLFAGGGGASLGLEHALGQSVDIAINHDPIALAVHKLNHPETRHLEADIWEVRPQEATGGKPVDILWASPDCTHFSVAKGGVPRDQGIRSLAWVVVRWAREVAPRIIFLENVKEFQGWGPLGKNGRPLRSRKGDTFHEWVKALEGLGYSVDWRVLDASLYGAPTRRKRLFVVARCDGVPISQSLNDPMRTITSRHRFGLVEVAGVDYQIVDIGMRMLEPHELLRAQFGEFADSYSLNARKTLRGKERPLSKADKVRLIGNSVPPTVASAVVSANVQTRGEVAA